MKQKRRRVNLGYRREIISSPIRYSRPAPNSIRSPYQENLIDVLNYRLIHGAGVGNSLIINYGGPTITAGPTTT